ncbi:MAG: pilus assembly protein [Planctomycetes bacterium]|nr:pilus assembly protein [Planctomycetota bacterium]
MARFVERLRTRRNGSREDGQAMVEFVIVFPVQFLFTVCLMQYAFLLIGRIATDHAAWIAARAALVACQPGGNTAQEDAERAAEEFLTPVTGRSQRVPANVPILYPGWGPMDRSTQAQAKTRVEVLNVGSLETADRVTVVLHHDFELVIPVANYMFVAPWLPVFYWPGVGPVGGGDPDDLAASAQYGAPHIVLRAERFVPKPWKDPTP